MIKVTIKPILIVWRHSTKNFSQSSWVMKTWIVNYHFRVSFSFFVPWQNHNMKSYFRYLLVFLQFCCAQWNKIWKSMGEGRDEEENLSSAVLPSSFTLLRQILRVSISWVHFYYQLISWLYFQLELIHCFQPNVTWSLGLFCPINS